MRNKLTSMAPFLAPLLVLFTFRRVRGDPHLSEAYLELAPANWITALFGSAAPAIRDGGGDSQKKAAYGQINGDFEPFLPKQNDLGFARGAFDFGSANSTRADLIAALAQNGLEVSRHRKAANGTLAAGAGGQETTLTRLQPLADLKLTSAENFIIVLDGVRKCGSPSQVPPTASATDTEVAVLIITRKPTLVLNANTSQIKSGSTTPGDSHGDTEGATPGNSTLRRGQERPSMDATGSAGNARGSASDARGIQQGDAQQGQEVWRARRKQRCKCGGPPANTANEKVNIAADKFLFLRKLDLTCSRAQISGAISADSQLPFLTQSPLMPQTESSPSSASASPSGAAASEDQGSASLSAFDSVRGRNQGLHIPLSSRSLKGLPSVLKHSIVDQFQHFRSWFPPQTSFQYIGQYDGQYDPMNPYAMNPYPTNPYPMNPYAGLLDSATSGSGLGSSSGSGGVGGQTDRSFEDKVSAAEQRIAAKLAMDGQREAPTVEQDAVLARSEKAMGDLLRQGLQVAEARKALIAEAGREELSGSRVRAERAIAALEGEKALYEALGEQVASIKPDTKPRAPDAFYTLSPSPQSSDIDLDEAPTAASENFQANIAPYDPAQALETRVAGQSGGLYPGEGYGGALGGGYGGGLGGGYGEGLGGTGIGAVPSVADVLKNVGLGPSNLESGGGLHFGLQRPTVTAMPNFSKEALDQAHTQVVKFCAVGDIDLYAKIFRQILARNLQKD